MKQGQSTKRPRGHRGNGRRPSGGRNSNFESSGPQGKIRGTAYQVIEKYQALGRDALTFGDRVAAENYFQHAEHYYRVMAANGGAEQRGGRNSSQQQNRPPQQQGQQQPQPLSSPPSEGETQAPGEQADTNDMAETVTDLSAQPTTEPTDLSEEAASEEATAEQSDMDRSPA